jgi:hypothetical protein
VAFREALKKFPPQAAADYYEYAREDLTRAEQRIAERHER